MAKIYLDTNIFLDAYEGSDDQAARLKNFFEVAKRQPGRLVTSELTLAELLGREAPGRGWAWQRRFYLELIVFSAFIDLRSVTRDVLLETGDYRRAAKEAGSKIHLADAIHIVTAIHSQCRYIFSSDKRLAVPTPLERVASDEAGFASLLQALDA